MKQTMVMWIGILMAAHVQAQLVSFSFTGAAGNEPSFGPDAQPVGAWVASMTRGLGLNPSGNADTFSASNWSTAGRDDSDYYSFSIQPELFMSLNLTRLVLDERRSASGIRDWCVRSSLDGFATDLSYFAVPDSTATRADQITLLGSEFSHVTSEVEFRIYGYRAESAGGTWRVDNVALYGGISAVPEPEEYASVFGAALVVFACIDHVRRQRLSPVVIKTDS
jgi:hypothetical protein